MRTTQYIALAVLGCTPLLAKAQADFNRYYVGPDQGVWSDPANWSASPAGPGGAGVPVASSTGLPYDGAQSAILSVASSTSVSFNSDYHSSSLVTFDLSASNGSTLTFTQPQGSITSLSSTFDSTTGGSVSYSNFGARHIVQDPTGALTLADSPDSNICYYLANNGIVQSGKLFIAKSGNATFNQFSGSVSATTNLSIAYAPNSTGLYILGTGDLSADSETIGQSGSATFRQTGGSNTSQYSLTIADSPSSTSTYFLAGGALHVNTGSLLIGSTGTLNQSAGALNAPAFQVDGLLTQSAGTLETTRIFGSGSLTLSGNARASSPLTHIANLSLSDNATLDLGAGALISDQSNAATLFPSDIHDNRIISSYAASDPSSVHGIGYATASDLGLSIYDGINLSPTSFIASYALLGDANLDGTINPADYAALNAGYSSGATGWTNGDFNHDGVVNRDDYLLIDRSYLWQTGMFPTTMLSQRVEQFGSSYAADLTAAVPEPTTLSLLLLGALPFFRRRAVPALPSQHKH